MYVLNQLVLLLFLVAPSQNGMISPTWIISVSGQIIIRLVLLGRSMVENVSSIGLRSIGRC